MKIISSINPFFAPLVLDVINPVIVDFLFIGGNTLISFKGIFINSAGTRIMIQEIGSAYEIFRYDLSTPWNITSGSYVSRNASLSTGDALAFKEDGLKVFTLKHGTKDFNQATLSGAWDMSTKGSTTKADYTNATSPTWLQFNNDGTKAYKNGNTGVIEWTLSTAYDSTTIGSGVLRSSTDTTRYDGMAFYDNGNYVILLDSVLDEINLVALSSAYDMSTMGGVLETHPVIATALSIHVSGGYLYVSETTNKRMYQYSLT